MVYKGRIIGLGLTKEGNPVAVYAISGRSDNSKKRVAKYFDEGYTKRVFIDSWGEPTEEQKRKADIYFYNAMKMFGDLVDGLPYLAISNGVHTDTIANVRHATPDNNNTVLKTLKLFGPEPDTLHTARIGGELNMHLESKYASIGIIPYSTTDLVACDAINFSELKKGEVRTISTYSGLDDSNPAAPEFKKLEDVIERWELDGKTAGELAGNVYNKIDPNLVVCTVAAVWNGTFWDVAVKNMHGDK
ncbi:MAG: IMP cyclohydrolase [Candidatus Nanoarchaeia archaeon]|nr:IMP cyclohydrolase [Candidatus Nanoarchaeia archaeon]MDD5239612.1 IMP cyclohydrolase [Candidatus Nanoarchaeia archaeon]